MYRVKHLLTSSALYSLYCSLILPYLNYCCEIWGNTYKSRVRPLHIIQKRAVRICLKADYRSHTRPMFYQLKTLAVQDMVDFNSTVLCTRYIIIYYQLILCCTSRKLMLVTITTSI